MDKAAWQRFAGSGQCSTGDVAQNNSRPMGPLSKPREWVLLHAKRVCLCKALAGIPVAFAQALRLL